MASISENSARSKFSTEADALEAQILEGLQQKNNPPTVPSDEESVSEQSHQQSLNHERGQASINTASSESLTRQQPNSEVSSLKTKIAELQTEADLYKNRWQSLQGQYKRFSEHVKLAKEEVERLTLANKNLVEEINRLRSSNPNIEAIKAEVEEGGLSPAMQNAAREWIRTQSNSVDVEARPSDQFNDSHEETLNDIKLAEVAASVPDWNIIDSDPRFQQWIHSTVRYGKPLSEMYLQSYRMGNISAVIEILQEFKKIAGPDTHKDDQRTVEPDSKPDASAESFTGGAENIAFSEIDAFNRKVMSGYYRKPGKAEEAEEISAMHDKAIAEGRVDYSR